MAAPLETTGIYNGATVAAQSTPNMTVAVAAGQVVVAGTGAAVTGGNLTVTAAHATQDRIDAIVVNAAGVKSVLAGPINDGLNAQPPDTTGYVVLAYIYVINQASADYTGTIINAVIDTTVAMTVTSTGGIAVVNLFPGTTSYTPAAGVVALQIEAIGGGGGSGASVSSVNGSAGGGGAGGSWSSTWSSTNVVGAHIVAVGAGGLGGSGTSGGAGGDSTFKDTAATVICKAVGGLPGFRGVASASFPNISAVGGNASDPGIGDVAAGTNAGGCGIMFTNSVGISGAGGSGPFGGNAIVRVNGNSVGGYGETYGGGAAGALTVSSGASQLGAAGGDGLITIREQS